jgi:NADH-quinone oxidoreductase subunit L
MVTAGVYMIGRNAVLFEHAPITLGIVAAIGAATALFAGTIGLVQNDIKRVLAYSTVSQLGYMFLAMGVGAFGAGIFHLYTHAFFKACLFLGSGAVIHALHGEQDIRHMGGLKKDLPITFWTFVIASIAIAGVPGLAGFFSKDEILFETFRHGHTWLWVIGVLTSLLTATYMFRLVFLTFFGERRHAPAAVEAHGPGHAHDHHGHTAAAHGHAPVHAAHDHGHGGHLHDAPPAMALALVVLALGSVLAGYVGFPHALGGHNALGEWLHPSFTATSRALAECNIPVALPGAPAGMTLAQCAPGDAVPAVASTATTAAEVALPAGALTAQEPATGGGEHAAAAQGEAHDETALELTLMIVSSIIAFLGIGLAAFLWLKNPRIPASLAAQFPGLHRLLLNKYYVDEVYDAAIVHPIQRVSTDGLWKGLDVKVVDGAVNLAGYVVAAASAVLRLMQTGSVRSYAASTFVGVVLVLGYYLWR